MSSGAPAHLGLCLWLWLGATLGREQVQASGLLRLSVLPEDRLQMKWRESEGSGLGYLVQVKPMAGDSEQEVILTTKTPKATVGGLSPSKGYTLQIFELTGSGRFLLARREFVIEDLKSSSLDRSSQRPLGSGAPEPTPSHMGSPDPEQASEPQVAFTPSQDPPTPGGSEWRETGPQFRCLPPVPADMVFLVDGSWSIGHSHFQQVKDFLASVIAPFEIGPDKVQVGLTQYSGDAQTEWDLNSLSTKEQVLAAVRRLRYKGGNTFTGLALTHVLGQNLQPVAGLRPEAAKVVILVTDGKSQDDVHTAARVLKDLGVNVFAVGEHHAAPLALESHRRVVVEGPAASTELHNLASRTEYLVSVFPIYEGGVGEGLRGLVTTAPLPPPRALTLAAVTPRTIHLTWQPSAGATHYLVRCSPASPKGEEEEREVQVGRPEVLLDGLEPGRDYEVSVQSLRGPEGSEARGIHARTQKAPSPSQLSVTELPGDAVQLAWVAAAPSGVLVYQITWTPLGEGKAHEISVPGNLGTAVLPGLGRHTEYNVTILAYYRDGARSDPVSLRYTPWFDLMVAFSLVEKAYASIRGVAMEPSAFGGTPTFTLFKDAQLTRRVSDVLPAPLPPEHTIVFLLRLLPETPREAFALWQMTAEDFQPLLGVLLDAGRKSLTYFHRDPRAALQEATFDPQEVRKIFFGSFHKVHVAVGRSKVRLYVDCRKVAERPLGEMSSPPAAGFVTLGRLAKARGPRSSSAVFQLQMLQIVCSDTWADEDRCCELPASRDGETCPAFVSACSCSSETPGPPGPQGPPVPAPHRSQLTLTLSSVSTALSTQGARI
ncbi:COL20A1 isoform 4 [Pan troglodytes]|uniref:COL20A1 isoform 4 n=1 Tax=Pan troglodytes TaxID=9598 RepID=A0A2J8KN42_PANTR|nr:COL20A1 isoform 4 [Pan troglodytes]